MGLFSKIKNGLKRTKEAIAYKLNKLFTGGVLTDEFYDELEETLLIADIGAETTEQIMDRLKDDIDKNHIRDTSSVREIFRKNFCGKQFWGADKNGKASQPICRNALP